MHLLDANRHLVEALRDALLERHELIGHEITDVLREAERVDALEDGRPSGRARHRPSRPRWSTSQPRSAGRSTRGS